MLMLCVGRLETTVQVKQFKQNYLKLAYMYAHFQTGAIPRVGAYFGQGSVPVTFDSLTCSGEENSVTKCNFTVGTSCFHSLDVGVQCPGKDNCGGS